MADESLDIAHNGSDTQRDKLRIDTIHWHLERLASKKYGPKATNTHEVNAFNIAFPPKNA